MSASTSLSVIVVVFSVALAAVAAAAETALTRMSRARAESLAHDQNAAPTALVEILDDRETNLAPLLLLRVAAHVAALTAVFVEFGRGRTAGGQIAAAAITGAVLYVVAEAVPRMWALQHPDTAARRATPVVRLVRRLTPLRWVTALLNAVANLILPGPARAPIVSEDELRVLTEAAAAGDAIDVEERDLIESVFALGDTIVREVMVPRTDMVTASRDAAISTVIDLAEDKGLSRFPVCGDGIDDIIGVCLVKDLVRAERAGAGDRTVGQEMRQPRFVPETKHAGDLLREMQAGQHHLSIVVDEYGGTAGLVTLEDLVEELVGEIRDEYDNEEALFEPLAGGELLVHGRMPVDQLNGLIAGELPDGDWDTVGGLIFNSLGRVPEIGESVTVADQSLRVERMEGRRITLARLSAVDSERSAHD